MKGDDWVEEAGERQGEAGRFTESTGWGCIVDAFHHMS